MGEILKIEKEKLNKCLLNNFNQEAIEQELVKEGIPDEFVSGYLKAYKKHRIEKDKLRLLYF